jgi:hypothetical protein
VTKRRIFWAVIAGALLLAWFLFPKGEDETVTRIEGRARRDLIEACNQAAARAGMRLRFVADDIRALALDAAATQGDVVALVSVLEARREGSRCRWNGIDPATLAPLD